MTAWKSRSKIACSLVANPPAIIFVSKGGQQGALVLVAGAVGVVGERGLFRQRGQTGQQCCARRNPVSAVCAGDSDPGWCNPIRSRRDNNFHC
jgi:hypothetical protein